MRPLPLFALALAACKIGSGLPDYATLSDFAVNAADFGRGAFGAPELVTISNYDADAMEPYISGDDQLLLFNDSNSQPNTELHWAMRTGPTSFAHMGTIASANSTMLDGVPSLADDGTLVFVSNRSYDTSSSTLYRAHFAAGIATGVELVPGVSRNTPGIVEFDAELSRDGQSLYYVVSQFSMTAQPKTADLFLADKSGDGFVPRADSATIFQAINTSALEYAPAISRDGLSLYFTRIQDLSSPPPMIYMSTRASTSEPFGPPVPVPGITGFVEGATISSDDKTLYYHHKDADDRYRIYRVTRP